MGFFTRGSRITKPPMGAQINWKHPLAADLRMLAICNEGSGTRMMDLARMGGYWQLPTSSATAVMWAGGDSGSTIKFDGSSSALVNSSAPGGVGAGDFTLFAYAAIDVVGGTQNIVRQDGGSPRRIYGLRCVSTIQVLTFDGGIQAYNGTTTLVARRFYKLVMTRTITENVLRGYVDGRLEASGTGTTANLETGSLKVGLGYDATGTSEVMTGRILMAGVAARAWTANMVQDWSMEPYGFLGPVTNRSYFSQASAASAPAPYMAIAAGMGNL